MSAEGPNHKATLLSQELCSFISECPSPFHTVRAIGERLERAGFLRLSEVDSWRIERGGRYYTTRNDSSIIALRVGEHVDVPCFRMVSSHSDSPTYKVKDVPELEGPGAYVRINVEGYGGLIDRTWLDRPLSIAGRALVQDKDVLRSYLIAPSEDLLLIPSVAIHQDREVNKGGALNRQIDMCPLFSAGELGQGGFGAMVAQALGVDPERIMGHDLMLVNRQPAVVWGAAGEFVSGPRLDDLQCAHASLQAFLQTSDEQGICVYTCLNNEEVGSGTMQGALSTFVPQTLRRICDGLASEDGLCASTDLYARALARSLLVSCDNAHAVHPNHPELYDTNNRVWLNQGVVIKESAAQRYTTDAVSRSVFKLLCRRADVPVQAFANRSDSPGGSTLGNLLVRNASMSAVDVGLPQLAMHSSYETAGVLDTFYLLRALREFYDTPLQFCADGSIAIG